MCAPGSDVVPPRVWPHNAQTWQDASWENHSGRRCIDYAREVCSVIPKVLVMLAHAHAIVILDVAALVHGRRFRAQVRMDRRRAVQVRAYEARTVFTL